MAQNSTRLRRRLAVLGWTFGTAGCTALAIGLCILAQSIGVETFVRSLDTVSIDTQRGMSPGSMAEVFAVAAR